MKITGLFTYAFILLLLGSCGGGTDDMAERAKKPVDQIQLLPPSTNPISSPETESPERKARLQTPVSSVNPGIAPDVTEPWHLFGKNGINLGPAWEITTGSKDITIAIIDNGFAPNHTAFSKGNCRNKIEHLDFLKKPKKSAHGQMVASVIATCGDNPLDIIGINAHSPVQWIEVGPGQAGTSRELIRWVLGEKDLCKKAKYITCTGDNLFPARVINRSAGSSSTTPYIDRALLLPVVEQAKRLESIIVAAAGNDPINADNDFPASATGVISVGSTNQDGVATKWSSWGETVEIMAPGEKISVATPAGKEYASGSSFAAPIITAVISLMYSIYPALNWKTAVYFLQSTAVAMDCHDYCIAGRERKVQDQCRKDCCRGESQVCTPGRVDAAAALSAAQKAASSGLPKVALVDSNKLLVGVSFKTTPEGRRGDFVLRNVGGASGKYLITSPDGALTFSATEIELAPKGQPNDSQKISIVTTKKFIGDKDAAIRIASPESGVLSTFSDEIVLYAKTDFSL